MKKFLSLVLLSLLVFTACSAKSEKQRFTDATVEATCMVFEAGNINDPELETKAKAIYKDNGFDVDDEAAMQEIASKYQNDEDVQKAVQDALKECAGDLLNGATTTPDATTPDAEATTPESATEEETTPATDATKTPEATTPATEATTPEATTPETEKAK